MITHTNNNFAYNNSTVIPIDKMTGDSRKTTAEELISVIEKKAEGKSESVSRKAQNSTTRLLVEKNAFCFWAKMNISQFGQRWYCSLYR
jgi:hypothetical protein